MITPGRMNHEPSLRATTTDLIETAENNDATALNQLIPLVYDELRALAHRRLAERSPRHARVVELRYFAGLRVEQRAEALAVSTRMVKSDSAMARAWLFSELQRA